MAAKSVADAIRRSRAARAGGGLPHPNRPLATFMFTGPADVGKRELAKSLADYLFGTEKALLCVPMDEYMEEHAVRRLLRLLAGAICRRQHRCVILIEEMFDNAHLDVINAVLQLVGGAEIADSQGRDLVSSLRNTVIIMTSNIYKEDTAKNATTKNKMIDEYVVFKPLDASVITHIHRDTDAFRF